MAKGDFYLKLDIDDWLNDPCLRGLKRENRDTWLTVCLLMHREGVFQFTGNRETLARKFSLSLAEFDDLINDLKATKTANVTLCRKNVTIKSRRFARDAKTRESNNLRKRKERQNGHVTPKSHESHNTITTSYKLLDKKEEENPENIFSILIRS